MIDDVICDDDQEEDGDCVYNNVMMIINIISFIWLLLTLNTLYTNRVVNCTHSSDLGENIRLMASGGTSQKKLQSVVWEIYWNFPKWFTSGYETRESLILRYFRESCLISDESLYIQYTSVY